MVETPVEIAVFFHSSFAENYFTTAPLTVIVKNGAPQPLTLKKTGGGAYAMIEVEKNSFPLGVRAYVFADFKFVFSKQLPLLFFFAFFAPTEKHLFFKSFDKKEAWSNGDKILSDCFVSILLSPDTLILSPSNVSAK